MLCSAWGRKACTIIKYRREWTGRKSKINTKSLIESVIAVAGAVYRGISFQGMQSEDTRNLDLQMSHKVHTFWF